MNPFIALRNHAKEVYDTLAGNELIKARTKGFVDPVKRGIESSFPMLTKDPQNVTLDDLVASGFGVMPLRMKLIKNAPINPFDSAYRGTHTAPNKNFGAPLHDLISMYGDDIYSRNAIQYYGNREPYDLETFNIFKRYRNKPDDLVDIYRAVPPDIKNFNDGDWVTVTKPYAKEHGYRHIGDDYNILQARVPAKALYTDANSPYEFGLDMSVLLNSIKK